MNMLSLNQPTTNAFTTFFPGARGPADLGAGSCCPTCCDRSQLSPAEAASDLRTDILVPLLAGLLEAFSDLLDDGALSSPVFGGGAPGGSGGSSGFSAPTPASSGNFPANAPAQSPAGAPAAGGSRPPSSVSQTPQADVRSIQEGNQHLVTQWGDTPYNAGRPGVGGEDAPYGHSDCVPTSAVIALSALGLQPRPSAEGASEAIDAMRDASLGYDSTWSAPMGFGQVKNGLAQYGAKTTDLDHNNLGSIDAALDRGNPVMVAGNPWRAWGQAELEKGNYLNYSDPGAHAMTILGRTEEGLYVMADPLFRNSTILVSADQLRTMFADGGANSGAMEVSR